MKNILKHTLFFICFLGTVNAQEVTTPEFSQTVSVNTEVPFTCSISSNVKVFNFDTTFYNTETNINASYNNGCVYGAIVTMKIGLGSNPNSTANNRRLPLNGEQGDIQHYLNYKIIDNKSGSVVDDIQGITQTVVSSSDRIFNLSINIPKEQPNIGVGIFSDRLPVYFDYY